MDVLFHVTTPNAKRFVAGLSAACVRAGISWSCFFTNDGVRALADEALVSNLCAAERAVVCEHSWDLHMVARECPIERGSQTINSALMAEARRVVSL